MKALFTDMQAGDMQFVEHSNEDDNVSWLYISGA